MPKLRGNLKAVAGRGKPPKPSPVSAPATLAANIRGILCPGTYIADSPRPIGATETAAEKAAGKKPVTQPTLLKTAEASAKIGRAHV